MKAKQKIKIGITIGVLITVVGVSGFHIGTPFGKQRVTAVSTQNTLSEAQAMAKQLTQNMNENIQAGEKSGQYKALNPTLYQKTQSAYEAVKATLSQLPEKEKNKRTKELKNYFLQIAETREYQRVIKDNQTIETQVTKFEQQMAENPFAPNRQQEYQQLKENMNKERTALVNIRNPALREGLLDHYWSVSAKWDTTLSVLPTLEQILNDLKGFAKNGNTFPATFQQKADLAQQIINEVHADNIKTKATERLTAYQKQFQTNKKKDPTTVSANAITLQLDTNDSHKDVQFARSKGLLNYVEPNGRLSVLVQNGNPVVYHDANGIQGSIVQKDLLIEYALFLGIPLSKDNLENKVTSVLTTSTKEVRDESFSIMAENGLITIDWRGNE